MVELQKSCNGSEKPLTFVNLRLIREMLGAIKLKNVNFSKKLNSHPFHLINGFILTNLKCACKLKNANR
jgi:hypothetical protein